MIDGPGSFTVSLDSELHVSSMYVPAGIRFVARSPNPMWVPNCTLHTVIEESDRNITPYLYNRLMPSGFVLYGRCCSLLFQALYPFIVLCLGVKYFEKVRHALGHSPVYVVFWLGMCEWVATST